MIMIVTSDNFSQVTNLAILARFNPNPTKLIPAYAFRIDRLIRKGTKPFLMGI